jgi:predicted ATPase/DNA-binding CsgD family transcriptional regulator
MTSNGESTTGVHNNLPGALSTFVERRSEQAEIGELLERVRFLTLTGTGGCGKTRLALRTADDKIDLHPDGVWWVELARLDKGELVPMTVAEAVGVKEVPGRTPLETLVEHFHDRRALLVLDNCEHLLAASAELVDTLLSACPMVTILATSRAPLGLPYETAWRVPSMSLPGEELEDWTEALRTSDALRLFVARAVQVRPNFRITQSNGSSIAEICRALDGIPLAIELAAARVRMMTPHQIAAGLDDRFRLLTQGSRSVLPRHRTLEASIDWSHELLSEGERILLRRLAVFSGGWTLDAAEEVCASGAVDRYAILDLLTTLVDKSLVTTEERGAEVRYSLLETVRQYAFKRLEGAGELREVRSRHLGYYLALAEASEPELLGAVKDDAVMRRLTDELPNLRSAMEWASGHEPDAGLRIVAALSLFWLFTGRFREGDAAYARALDSADERATAERGRALAGRGHLAQHAGAPEWAHRWAATAQEVGQECGDHKTQARALNTLGRAVLLADPSNAQTLLERSLEHATRAGDQWCSTSTTQALAILHSLRDEFDQARAVLKKSYESASQLGYRRGVAIYWWCMGWEAIFRGRLEEAEDLLGRSIEASDEVGDPFPRAVATSYYAYLLYARGEFEAAYRLAAENVQRAEKAGVGLALGFANQVLGRVEMALGLLVQAREHLGRAVEADRALAFARSWDLEALGTLNQLEGRLEEARGSASEAAETARRIGSAWMLSGAELLLARIALSEGDTHRAERYVHDALGRLMPKDLLLKVPECLELLAVVAAQQESFSEAARLFGAAAGGRDSLGIVRFPAEPEFWQEIEQATKDALGLETYRNEIAGGGTMKIEEAVTYARRARGERKRPSRGWASLTPTELAVVDLATQGLTNPQIGDRMFISRGTVKAHLSHIFAKLDVSSRSQLAAEAARRGAGSDSFFRTR